MQYYSKDYWFVEKCIRSNAKKRFCLFLFHVVTSPAQGFSHQVSVENRPYKPKTHECHPSVRMANLSLHLKSTWVLKEFGSNGKTTYRIYHASDWHSAMQGLKENAPWSSCMRPRKQTKNSQRSLSAQLSPGWPTVAAARTANPAPAPLQLREAPPT